MITQDRAAPTEAGRAGDRQAFVGLCATAALAYCSYAICRMPMLPLLAREMGATPPMVGLVVGASTLTGIVLKLPAGAWSDVLGRRPLLVLGALVFAVMPFTYLAATSLAMLIAIRFVHGSATAIFGPVASAGLSDIAPADRRATWLGTYATVQASGQAAGPVLAGYLIAAGRSDLAFLAAGALAAATPVLAARWRASQPRIPGSSEGMLRGILDVCRRPQILLTSVTQAAQFVLHGALSAFLPLFAHEVIGLSPSRVGWLFALQTVTTLTTRPIGGAISDRVGRRGVIALGLVLCGIAVWCIPAANGFAGLMGSVVVYAVGAGLTVSAASARITDLARQERYGTAHGVFGSIYDIGDAAGPLVGGLLVASVGYQRMFQCVGSVGLAMALVFWFGSDRRRPTASRGR